MRCSVIAIAASLVFTAAAQAQTADNLNALKGLAPFSALENTDAGKAALAANYSVTGEIQNGTDNQPGLEPFPAQQAQALRDATITFGDAAQLSDGLGSKLGPAYLAMANYRSLTGFTSVSPDIANLIAYTATLTAADSNSGKFFFANKTQKNGKGPDMPVSAAAAAIMTAVDGTTDVFGRAYGLPAGSPKADKYGDSRPYQTEKTVLKYSDADYFGQPSDNSDYLYGPAQDLTDSPSFPSGHTTYGYTEAMLLAFMVPGRYPQMVVRGGEYGNDRIVVGAHYAMDVIAGRTLAYYDLAQMLAGNPEYVGQKEGKAKPILKYMAAVRQASLELMKALAAKAGESLAEAAAQDTGRFSDPAKDEAFYESTLTYGLPVVYAAEAAQAESVAAEAPQAGYLLKVVFPYLTLSQADQILTSTEGAGGGFLDNGSAFGLYSRLDLYKAGLEAEQMAPK